MVAERKSAAEGTQALVERAENMAVKKTVKTSNTCNSDGRESHLQTRIVHNRGFNHNTFILTLPMKIVLCDNFS